MTTVVLKTLPENDTQFAAVYYYQGEIWSVVARINDGQLEVFDTLVEDEFAPIESWDDTIAEGYEMLHYIIKAES